MSFDEKHVEKVVGQKSLKVNMILNAIKGMMSVLFPLITFPYISRVLGVEEIGRYNFSYSIINYFLLLAGLGVSLYAVREGARFRNNVIRLQSFASEVFSINIISTLVSYVLLLIVVLFVPNLWSYSILIGILSVQIVFRTLGMEWMYSIHEDYLYITIRTIIMQMISLILLFAFVKTEQDVNIYAMITIFSSSGADICNFLNARKYCKVRLTRNIDWRKHLKPILVLFGMAVTVTIYVSSDITLLGFLCSDYEVGIYSVSVKVYTVIKGIIAAIVTVSIPRMAFLFEKNDKSEISTVASDIYNTLITILFPAVAGVIVLREEIVLIISGKAYMSAVPSLVILSITMIFCMGAYFWGQAILVPVKKEKVCFKASLTSAVVCIVLNFVLIPLWQEKAAAFTTLIAEGLAFFICRQEGIKHVNLKDTKSTIWKSSIGCIGIVAVSIILRPFKNQIALYTILIIMLSTVVYFLSQIILKNESILSVTNHIKVKVIGRK